MALLIGALGGLLSGLGIGGGTLLMVWLTAFAGWDQRAAQGLNLLYYLPTAAAAGLVHAKGALIDLRAALWAAGAGVITAAGAAWLAMGLDTALLRKGFGLFLLAAGISELMKKSPKDPKSGPNAPPAAPGQAPNAAK